MSDSRVSHLDRLIADGDTEEILTYARHWASALDAQTAEEHDRQAEITQRVKFLTARNLQNVKWKAEKNIRMAEADNRDLLKIERLNAKRREVRLKDKIGMLTERLMPDVWD